MARDADGRPQAPLETRGRRPISQKMRDVSDRLKSVGRFAESLPAIIKSAMMISFLVFYVYSLRAQISIIKSSVNPEGLVRDSWAYTPTWDTSKHYIVYGVLKGGPVAGMDIFYPDKNWSHALLQVGVLMQATAGDSLLGMIAEGSEAALIISILDDIFNRRIFIDRIGARSAERGLPEEFVQWAAQFFKIPGLKPLPWNAGTMTVHEMWISAGRPLPPDADVLLAKGEEIPADLTPWFWSWQISHLLAALAFAAISWFLITSGPRALSLK